MELLNALRLPQAAGAAHGAKAVAKAVGEGGSALAAAVLWEGEVT